MYNYDILNTFISGALLEFLPSDPHLVMILHILSFMEHTNIQKERKVNNKWKSFVFKELRHDIYR